MKYGVCSGLRALENISTAAELGYDYVEPSFCDLSRSTQEEFDAYKAALAANKISCESANCFIPGDLRISGKEVNYDGLRAYLETGMKRGASVGLKTVVLGSSGARNLDDDTSYADGFRRIVCFLAELACPIAAKYGVTVVLEPLCKLESNIINTVKEGAMVASATGCENAGGLADIYHMAVENDSFNNIRDLKGLLKHAHISYPSMDVNDKRIYMKDVNEYDYAGFISALEYAGCLRCSIEAKTKDFATDAKAAMAVINQLKNGE